MTDRTTALEFAFEKLVEQLCSTGALDASALAENLEAPGAWLGADNEGTQALAELARTVRRAAGVEALDSSDQYPAAEWELLTQLTLQFLSIRGQLDRQEFAEYLDMCCVGMRRHGAPIHLQDAVARVSDYSRGTEDLPRWLREILSRRSVAPGADEPH